MSTPTFNITGNSELNFAGYSRYLTFITEFLMATELQVLVQVTVNAPLGQVLVLISMSMQPFSVSLVVLSETFIQDGPKNWTVFEC